MSKNKSLKLWRAFFRFYSIFIRSVRMKRKTCQYSKPVYTKKHLITVQPLNMFNRFI
eukprot:UN15536